MTVAVIGAGLAGLTAARTLTDLGHPVVVHEALERVGGRLATVRLGDAVADHGAQFFTVRGAAFSALVERGIADGAIAEWCRGFEVVDGYPRFRGATSMADFAAWLADGLDVRLGSAVHDLRDVRADAYVVTAPVPEALALLTRSDRLPNPDLTDRLAAIAYNATLALVCVVDEVELPAPGALQQPSGELFSFIADNRAKGVSARAVLTFHVNNATSRRLWDTPDTEVIAELLAGAAPWLTRSNVEHTHLERWRYAGPQTPFPEAHLVVRAAPQPVVLAGDAFDGPKIEGAFRSGLSAALAVAAHLS